MRTNPVSDTAAVTAGVDFASSAGFNAVYVGGTGTLIVVEASGNIATYANVAAGIWHPIQGKGIAAATTATGLRVAYA
ncbi:spike base protein, RCAP_Rcc01079 family [Methylobacterium sp. Gmos1]